MGDTLANTKACNFPPSMKSAFGCVSWRPVPRACWALSLAGPRAGLTCTSKVSALGRSGGQRPGLWQLFVHLFISLSSPQLSFTCKTHDWKSGLPPTKRFIFYGGMTHFFCISGFILFFFFYPTLLQIHPRVPSRTMLYFMPRFIGDTLDHF